MKDCDKDLRKYHDEEVTLPSTVQSGLRNNRNANRDRLKAGLSKMNKGQPDDFIIQGSYAMKTMKQHPDNDYDIDDGAAFQFKKMLDDQGRELSHQKAKELVRDGILAGGGNLPSPPKVLKNCVRIKYAGGHHVDIPVYRILKDSFGNETLELAGGDGWRESNPREITDWFRKEETKTQKEDEAEPQLRRQVRMVKMYACNNLGDDALSGLILTVLTSEALAYYDSRDDQAFRNILRSIKNRLAWNKQVHNPADTSEELTKESDRKKIDLMIEKLSDSLSQLAILDDPGCTKREARQAWDRVFDCDFFSKLHLQEQSSKVPATPSNSYPDKRVNIQGPGTSA